jgi:hypothetical protein
MFEHKKSEYAENLNLYEDKLVMVNGSFSGCLLVVTEER